MVIFRMEPQISIIIVQLYMSVFSRLLIMELELEEVSEKH